ncbi:A24 family peptidase [Cupriavidus sp. 30B13]|uniref:A24 family peptidase n=1 Tax=Cupriavidus sp. 30B13 TaxID=3384241 RepID=UPI003B90C3A7
MIGVIAVLFCAATIWSDLAFRKVPNAVLAATLVAVGLVLLFGHVPDSGLLSHLLGFVLGFLVMLPVYALGMMGAGDVKFFAVTGLITGPLGLVTVWVVGNVLALVHALAVRVQATAGWAIWRDHVMNLLQLPVGAKTLSSTRRTAGARGIPYAAYLAIGLLIWMVSGR